MAVIAVSDHGMKFEKTQINELSSSVDTHIDVLIESVSKLKENWQDDESDKVLPQIDDMLSALKASNQKTKFETQRTLNEIGAILQRNGVAPSAGNSVTTGMDASGLDQI